MITQNNQVKDNIIKGCKIQSEFCIMQKTISNMEYEHKQLCNASLVGQLQQQLQKIPAQQIPKCITTILNALANVYAAYHESTESLQSLIDRLCDHVLSLNGVECEIESIKKQAEIDIFLQKLMQYPHCQEIQISAENEAIIKKCRHILSQYFHLLVHYTTLKNIPKICVIFYKLVSLQMLDLKIINYFMLTLTLSYENIKIEQYIKIIKKCLLSLFKKKVIYVGASSNQIPNKKKKNDKKYPINYHLYENVSADSLSFVFITYVIYFGSSSHKHDHNHSQYIDLLMQILQNPIEVSGMVISFRSQFPSSEIFTCRLDLETISACIIDSFFIKSLLTIYLDYNIKPQHKPNVYTIIYAIVKSYLNVQIVRNMIKKLQIAHYENSKQKWHDIFLILKATLPEEIRSTAKYLLAHQGKFISQNKSGTNIKNSLNLKKEGQPSLADMIQINQKFNRCKLQLQKDVLIFKRNSFVKHTLAHQFTGFTLVFLSFRILDEYILLKLKNQQNQIWLMARHIENFFFQFSIIRLQSNNPVQMEKIQINWNPFEKHTLQCKVKADQIIFEFSPHERIQSNQKRNSPIKHSESQQIGILKQKNIKPTQIVIGSEDFAIPSYISQLSTFSLKYCQGKGLYDFIFDKKEQLNQISLNVTTFTKSSLIVILKKVGDLDLFFLIVSHLIKKVEGQQALKEMLKEVIDFLEYLVVAKGVLGVKLTEQAKQHRFNNVKCLVYLATKYKRPPDAIFQIFRLLTIRGNKKPMQNLQIFCNIGLWKQVPWVQHYKIIDKIKQNCGQLLLQSSNQMLGFMRKIMLDFIIFYKNTQIQSENTQQQLLIKHSQILKLVYDCVTEQKVDEIMNYILFLLKILHLMLDRTKSSGYIDTTLGFQITNLIYRLLFTIRQQQYQSTTQYHPAKIMGSPERRPMKTTKLGLLSSKSMNISFGKQEAGNEELILMKIEQILYWTSEIIRCLNDQVLFQGETIKYYDWQWQYKPNKNNSSIYVSSSLDGFNLEGLKQKHKTISEIHILTLCQYIQTGLLSYNKNSFLLFSPVELSQNQERIFWEINLFDERVSQQRVLQTLRYGIFEKIKWDEKKIEKVFARSFDMIENGSILKLPEQLYESMKIQNIDYIHNILISIYLDKCQEIDPIKKQKWAQNIMYIISNLPDSFYTNTQLLREELSKEKRNLKTLEIVQMHLIIKQLVKQGFKLVKQLKSPCVQVSQQMKSTIFALYDNKAQLNFSKQQIKSSKQDLETSKTKSRKGSNDIVVFGQLESVDFQQSFCSFENQRNQFITTQMLKKSLEHYRLLATPAEMESFYKISSLNSSQKQAKQQLKAHIQNFNINIDAIIEILEQVNSSQTSKISQLQNYIFFIDKHIYRFSKMILNQYLFQQIKLVDDKQRNKRKKSFKVVKNYKIKEEAENMMNQFLKERRISFYKMQRVWLNVQKNNKHLWELFFKSDFKHQSVDSFCSPIKLKGLIKVDYQRRQIELPKTMTILSNKFSISGTSQDKDTLIQGETDSSIFKDAALYQQQESSDRDKQQNVKTTDKKDKQLMNIRKIKKKKNQFSVLYITTTMIYQGIISCEKQSIKFTENSIPDENFYDNICANQNERRSIFDIQKKREQFQIKFNEKSTMIPKKYLYNDGAVQIYSENKTYFLVFRKGETRDIFFQRYENLKGVISNDEKLKQLANKQAERWANGDISNFTYLMHVNDLSGRTFNDMSQYYIFPWILKNYQSQKFNKKFLRNQKNYRDLSLPIGAINPKRLEELLNRYQESLKYPQTQSYLYGSFCSNPAIVCNFMVRLEPFSMHHYLLQSKQFDLADRIFYSLASQFHGCSTNMGDYKELIPEFYSCSQFLRNRNKYKFGQRQNKQQVNNVQLPPWARYEFGCRPKITKKCDSKNTQFHVEDFFIFRMRKCLESQIVTRSLNRWIDLFFGPYSRKEKAMQRNNLYLPNIYKNQINKDRSRSKQSCRIFFKQFGQMPKQIFARDHKSYKNSRSYYKIRHSQASFISQIPATKDITSRNYYANQKYIVVWDQNNINVIQIKNKSGFIQKNQNNLTQLTLNKNQKIIDLAIITASVNNGEDNRKIEAMLYLRQKKLRVREMTISTFRKKLEFKQQQTINCFSTESKILKIYDEKNLILITQQNTVKIYQYSLAPNTSQQKSTQNKSVPLAKFGSLEAQTVAISMNKHSQLRFSLKYEFTQHKSKIQHLVICHNYGLAISIDSNRKVYVLRLNQKQFEILQYFRLKKLTNCQFISQVQIHQMGYMIILTNLNCIHVFNLMGDFLLTFNGSTLKNINKKMQRVKKSVGQNYDKNKVQSKLMSPSHSETNNRKKSGGNFEDVQNLMSCEFVEQEIDNSPSVIVINEQQDMKTAITEKIQSNSVHSHFSKDNHTQIITYFTIWNHQSGQLIISTSLENIYRIDLFMMDDCQKSSLTNFIQMKDRKLKSHQRTKKSDDRILPSKFQFFRVNRIGRHWQCWAITTNEIFKMESQDYRNAQKRNEEYKKKYVLE